MEDLLGLFGFTWEASDDSCCDGENQTHPGWPHTSFSVPAGEREPRKGVGYIPGYQRLRFLATQKVGCPQLGGIDRGSENRESQAAVQPR
jgi:hypothetical protein